MWRESSIEELRSEYEHVLREIASHPLNSAEVQEAHRVIDEHKGREREEIDAALRERGLLSPVELGKIQVKSSLSFARLHRRRVRLESKLKKRAE